ncbi:Peptidase_M13_N domain-containing protein [Caenorhabditis elegans]|uniref:Peptidase_M13_N domain-containing protein n=1 Tax=Caenorhabditis elegans TaxID=6239 RepID=Q95ZU0_CAEEL|nr:Peptidase_M13_N domain-containing protein [Caenorhabditis elegans]CCD70886.2 Peptidase_M13_N domain-containing protein [Caenorhabditis elegans]|eukprot:NP_001257057.2 NEPrilysin metallopeptidase family [Caenorhabditis elegans]
MRILLFLIFITSVYSNTFDPADVFENALLTYVNKSVCPCENFYRHACSFDSPRNLMATALKNLTYELRQKQADLFWNHITLVSDYNQKWAPQKDLIDSHAAMVEFFVTFIYDLSVSQDSVLDTKLVIHFLLTTVVRTSFRISQKM